MTRKQPVCKGCGQAIWGDYLTALGATWHPEHFICAGCGRPIGGEQFFLHDNAAYHATCYSQQIAAHCAYCGKPLLNEYLVDHWGTKFCKEHQGQYPSCSFCGRLVPPQQQEARGEMVRCPVCRATAIETVAEARPLYSQAIQWVSSQGLRYNSLPLSLELCDRAKLAELLREASQTHSLGATTSKTYTQNGHVVRNEVSGIAVLQGLPAALFQGVTVHELGHVWLIVQGIEHLPGWAEEGFCELLSYRYYHEINTPESRYHALNIEQNADPVYGEGFRRVRALAEALGFPRFIEGLRTTKRLPSL